MAGSLKLWVGWATVACLVAVTGVGVASAAPKPPPGPPFKSSDACTYFATQQVEKAFGGPVTVDASNRGTNLPGTCAYLIGNPFQPTGILVAVNLFPGFLVPAGQTGTDVVESQRAVDAQAGYEVVDAPIGKHGYFNVTHPAVSLVASSKFAFSLAWSTPAGGTLTPALRKQLTTLAKAVVAKAVPKARGKKH